MASPPACLNNRQKQFNPVAQIRNLIQNLDAELALLCTQCQAPNPEPQRTAQSKINEQTRMSITKPKISKTIVMPQIRQIKSATSQPFTSSNMQSRTLANVYRAKVIDAYRNRRIFTVHGNYHTVRRALFNRGWLEKLSPDRYLKLQTLTADVLLAHAKRGNEYEAVLISRLINHFPAFFIWQGKGHRDLYADVLPYRNRVRRGRSLDFSTKIGLIGCTEHEQWCHLDGVCRMTYPRFYRLGGSYEDRLAFIEDFRSTQCRCLIHFVHENMNKVQEMVDELHGSVEVGIYDFAMDNLRKELNDKEHFLLDIDSDAEAKALALWQNFMINSNAIIHKGAKFHCSAKDLAEYDRVGTIHLNKLYEKYPNYKWDGSRNLWILKPGYSCRGIGIIIRNSLDDILNVTTNNSNRRYIAQKYIERPLLIYKTKFDIRQYMLLVINDASVVMWMYRQCYFRFSSQEFNMNDLRESIHLTNNCVQRKYRNNHARDQRLPRNNMWSLDDFKEYMKTQNKPDDFWHNEVYKNMKENLIAVVMASMEETDFVQNAFELYGCDFMLDEEYRPILIEINSTPDLSHSTTVTARLCPTALRDVIKVIVDVPKNPRAPTGFFEKIFEIDYRIKRNFDPKIGLQCSGKAMKLYSPTVTSKYSMHSKTVLQASTPPTAAKKNHFKVKFFARPFKNMKLKKSKKEPAAAVDSVKSNNNLISNSKNKLKSETKEALALQYTLPK